MINLKQILRRRKKHNKNETKYLVKEKKKDEKEKPTKTTFCLLKTVSNTRKKMKYKKIVKFYFLKIMKEIHGIVQYKNGDTK